MRRLPSLNALRTFEAAARLGSFSQAAKELRVTHGAVSRAVAGLESWLEVPLFQRGARLNVTSAGKTFQQEIGSALDRLAAATAQVTAQRNAGALRVDALPTFAMHWLIPRLPGFHAANPAVALQLATSERHVDALSEGFDVAIRRGPDRWKGLRATRFLDETATPVCTRAYARSHGLAEVSDLARATWLEADTRPDAFAQWLRVHGTSRVTPTRIARFDHFFLALQAARDGLGVAIGGLPILESELAGGVLFAPFPSMTVATRSYYALVRRGRPPGAAVAFVAWLLAEGRHATARGTV